MTQIYQEVIEDLDRRIAHMQGVRDQVALLAGADDNAVAPQARRGRTTKGRTKVGGGDQVVLEVIREGANTLPKIILAAKVKPTIAKASVRRLRQLGKVRMHGTRRSATYEARK